VGNSHCRFLIRREGASIATTTGLGKEKPTKTAGRKKKEPIQLNIHQNGKISGDHKGQEVRPIEAKRFITPIPRVV